MAEFDDLLETLKRAAASLRDADVSFLLGGGLAVWARGGPETEHDLDFMVKPEDADRALEALALAGFRTEKPPEEWLYKGWEGDRLIDLIFDPAGNPVDDAMFERADDLEVQAVAMKVMSLEDVMVTKLLAMREHEVDLDDPLETARALREQIDWDTAWEQTSASPYARTFFYLAEQLDILDGRWASPSESGSSKAPSEAARRA